MIHGSDGKRQSVFSRWLRTGRVAVEARPDGVEVKFNPWHDPADGRFTHAGSGNHYGGGGDSANGARDRAPNGDHRAGSRGGMPSGAGRSRPQFRTGGDRVALPNGMGGTRPRRGSAGQPGGGPNPVAEFFGGFGQGVRDVAKDAVAGIGDALTTNPATSLLDAGRGIARRIDGVVAAEATPARVQVSRAVDAVANASARDLGHATGAVATNVGLVAVPGAAVSRVSAARSLRLANRRPSFPPPPQIRWIKEKGGRNTHWQRYQDAADGTRPNLAPALMRTMPDGSKRPVKFDGIRGEYVIDRKWKVVDAPHARAQVRRQTQALSEHRLMGTWEVRNERHRIKARKLFEKMGVHNIIVRVVKP